eukprot:7233416-Prymnesium_polylepis.1
MTARSVQHRTAPLNCSRSMAGVRPAAPYLVPTQGPCDGLRLAACWCVPGNVRCRKRLQQRRERLGREQ